MQLLLFRLYGPLASWGEIAVGESRHTAAYPGKSAILGLVAAALGVERYDDGMQSQLQQGYAIAVEVLSSGQLLRDYHTTQVPDAVGAFSYRSRRDEVVIGRQRLGTILSCREYRCDALAVVALRALPAAPFGLQLIAEKLRKPLFQLYLGRKSCPLAAPLDPQILVGQSNFLTAFKAYCHAPLLPTYRNRDAQPPKRDCYWLGIGEERLYYWEGSAEDFADSEWLLNRHQSHIRHDQSVSRRRWQFAKRQEHFFYQGVE